ncbi:hypothetical protein EUTSA_v10001697mg [Eutrema salsugineum]|uniref:Knottins-like domain-containing protein n=1 Tax=Eutrema salsugineum TaxID=72664 RepID=V4N1L3_EUTSA|nr:defensin-like protein 193 [Eutrema salsugineum]ESQ38976.1 hypothetical protein EUTSA_v10001697mg [Eutrema salsugineum]
MATKSVSSLTIFFILFLVIFEVSESTNAQDRKCLKEYGGNVGFSFCAPKIFPSFCYRRCRDNKGAKGGRCRSGAGGLICLCDFCSDKP